MSIDYADPDVWNDPAKDLWRKKLREFIQKSLPFIRPKDMKVVCLPGAGAKEVLDVYLPLGIPPKNITGIEENPKIAEQLRSMQLGIDIKEMYDLEFFRKSSGRYHVISLDYKGLFRTDHCESMELIATRDLLGDCGILSTVFLAAREDRTLQERMRLGAEGYISEIMQTRMRNILRPKHEQTIAKAMEHIQYMKRLEKSSPRSPSLHEFKQTVQAAADQLIDIIQSLDRDKEEFLAEAWKLHTANFKTGSLDSLRDATPYDILCAFYENKAIEDTNASEALRERIFESDTQWPHELAQIVEWRLREGYAAKSIERYRYRSNKGSPMMADMFYFTRDRKLIRRIDDLVEIGNETVQIRPMRLSKLIEEFIQLPWQIDLADDAAELPTPEYLGKAREEENRQVLSPETVLLLAETRSSKEITVLDPHYTVGKIAALKAHVTMGTYTKIDGMYMKTSELERMTAPGEAQ